MNTGMSDDVGVGLIERHGAYALITLDGMILTTRYTAPDFRLALPGGGIEDGESTAEAVVREVAEETGFRVLSADPIGTFYEDEQDAHWVPWDVKVLHLFQVSIDQSDQQDASSDPEFAGLAWRAPSAILADRPTQTLMTICQELVGPSVDGI